VIFEGIFRFLFVIRSKGLPTYIVSYKTEKVLES
jgi:hypothetical protein